MTTNFESILSKKPEDIIPPLVLPPGAYLCVINGMYTLGESTNKKTPFVNFPSKILQAMPGVDESAISAIVGGVGGKELKGRMATTFYLSEAALFMVDDFLTKVLDIPGDGRSLKERFGDTMGKQFIVNARQVPSDDGSRLFAEVAGYAKP